MSNPQIQESRISELRAKALFVTADGKEICVLCKAVTDVDFETPVGARMYYIEGCGQLCPKCGKKVYDSC